MYSARLVALTLSLLGVVACAPLEEDELAGDPEDLAYLEDSEPLEESEEAEDLGRHDQAIGSGSDILWAEPGHVQYRPGPPNFGHLNIRYAMVGSAETQVENTSGVFDLWGAQNGALYSFRVQSCWRFHLQSSRCSAWSLPSHIYVQAEGTRWTDAGLFTNPDFAWAFEGGWEDVPGQGRRKLQVCSVPFHTGQILGKFLAGNCYIGWGGQEHAVGGSMVLLTVASPRWVGTSNGYLPPHAVPAGYEYGPQYPCRAWVNNGMHPGRAGRGGCQIGWGGAEVVVTNSYEVLTSTP